MVNIKTILGVKGINKSVGTVKLRYYQLIVSLERINESKVMKEIREIRDRNYEATKK